LNPPPPNAILITGSLSITRWNHEMEADLAPLTVIPRGFGGSRMADVLHYVDRVITVYEPRAVVIYEGDNDTWAGFSAETIVEQFEEIAARIHDAMIAAEAAAERRSLTDLRWVIEPVILPPRPDLDDEALLARIRAAGVTESKELSRAALMLTYLRRRERPIPVTCLHFGAEAAILHLPGETFIEYQLHAQAARPDAFVAVAGYGDLGPGYITLERSFAEGGYEPTDAFVSGDSETILRGAIDRATSNEQ
jgi:hypothetical protein